MLSARMWLQPHQTVVLGATMCQPHRSVPGRGVLGHWFHSLPSMVAVASRLRSQPTPLLKKKRTLARGTGADISDPRCLDRLAPGPGFAATDDHSIHRAEVPGFPPISGSIERKRICEALGAGVDFERLYFRPPRLPRATGDPALH